MAREVRKVPAGWIHPVWGIDTPEIHLIDREINMHDRPFEPDMIEWLRNFDDARNDQDSKYYSGLSGLSLWLTENPAPMPQRYRPWKPEEATHYQSWQTVGAGTPVSPAFSKREELAVYRSTHGDYWDQKRGDPPWPKDVAEDFVNGKSICLPNFGSARRD
jgi:hypothetical protein